MPKVDERGQALRLRDQRTLAIEMDKFLVTRKWERKCDDRFKTEFEFLFVRLVNCSASG